jgi:hypothetical protein
MDWLRRSRRSVKSHRSVWQHDNYQFRLVAVEHSRCQDLMDVLPRMAIADPSPSVRLVALIRCADIGCAYRALVDDVDPDVRRHARRLYNALMSGSQSETTQFPCGLPASGVFQFNLTLGG